MPRLSDNPKIQTILGIIFYSTFFIVSTIGRMPGTYLLTPNNWKRPTRELTYIAKVTPTGGRATGVRADFSETVNGILITLVSQTEPFDNGFMVEISRIGGKE